MGHVFVVTYGRSGSTLLQGLLNALPGTLVRGESEFFLHGLFKGHASLAEVQQKWSGPARTKGSASAFYGADVIDLPTFDEDLRRMVDRQLLGDANPDHARWLGFKEVLWHQVTPEETTGFIEFLNAVFPDARYVLHRRNHEHVLVSGFWKKWDDDQARAAVLRVEELQDALAAACPDRVCWTSYEELTSPDEQESKAVLQRLVESLGHSLTPQLLGKLRETLTIGHGPNPSTGVKPVPATGGRKAGKGAADKPAREKASAEPLPDPDQPKNKVKAFAKKKEAKRAQEGGRPKQVSTPQGQSTPVVRRPAAHDGPPRVAVMTMVHNEAGMLPKWVSYYGQQVGVDHLLVLDDNSNDDSTAGLPCPVIKLPEHPWKQQWGIARVGLANRIAEGLLSFYDAIIFTDVDEFLVPDPAKYDGLVDYIAANPDPDVLAPLGMNVIHKADVEPDLDADLPTLQQRTYVKFAPGMCKPLIKRSTANWSTAFHGSTVPFTIDPDLLLIHLKYYNLPSLAAVATHRHQMHEEEDRGNPLSAWALDADELTSRMRTWSTVPEGQTVAELDPAAVDFSGVVRLSKKGIYRAWGPHLPEMDKNPLLRLPERYRSAL